MALRELLDFGGSWPQVEHLCAHDYPPSDSPAVQMNLARAAGREQRRELRARALERAASDPALHWQVVSEHACDAAATNDAQRARHLADEVLAHSTDPFASARALEALGRVELWSGDNAGRSRGIRLMEDAIRSYRALSSNEWAGFALTWLGYAGYYMSGDHDRAEALMREGLALLRSPHRQVTVLTFLADVLCERGDWAAVDAALDRASELCPDDFVLGWDYIAWGRAKEASARGDQVGTVRWLKEAAATADPWIDTVGGTGFLAEGAQLLSRVGDVAGALQWLDKALSRPLGLVDPFHAQCEILAVHGDPTAALHALDRLPYEDGPWEPRLEWHLTVLRALALLRAGRYAEVPKVAAAALDQGARVAGAALRRDGAAEPLVLLAPLAAAAGSDVAARLLSPDHFLVHLFGAPTLRIGGDEMAVPAGKPGELFRLVAVHPGGMPAEQAIDQLWPAATPTAGPKHLRNALHRLHTAAGPSLVRRDHSRLSVGSAWVDVNAFRALARSVASGSGTRPADGRVHAALSLWTGEPLPDDVYHDWAIPIRGQLEEDAVRLRILANDSARGPWPQGSTPTDGQTAQSTRSRARSRMGDEWVRPPTDR